MLNPIVKYILNNHILTTVIIIAIGFFMLQIKGILLGLFMAYILMASIHPFVRTLEKYKVPKVLAIVLLYAVIIAVIVILVIPILPFVVSQVQSLFKAIPLYLDSLSRNFGFKIDIEQIQSYITPIISAVGENAFSITTKVFGGLFSILTVFILSFYLLIDRERLGKEVPNALPLRFQEKTRLTIHLIEEKLGAWLRGQIVLSFAIGFITFITLTLLQIPFALPLAILAGFLEIIPTIGPIVAAIPAVIVAFAISPITGLIVMVSYVGIQVAENNILVPKIMQKAVGLNPVVILISILIGGQLFGIIGALLSIPFISAAIIIYREFK